MAWLVIKLFLRLTTQFPSILFPKLNSKLSPKFHLKLSLKLYYVRQQPLLSMTKLQSYESIYSCGQTKNVKKWKNKFVKRKCHTWTVLAKENCLQHQYYRLSMRMRQTQG